MIDLLLGDIEFTNEQIQRGGVHLFAHLEANGRAEASLEQTLFQNLDEVFCFVLVDLDVLVAGHPEGVVLENLHAREEVL